MVLIIIGLRLLATFWNTAFLALVITISLTPMVSFLKRKGWPSALATGAPILLLLIVSLFVILLIVHSASEFSQYLHDYDDGVTQTFSGINNWLAGFQINSSGTASFFEKLVRAALGSSTQALAKIGSLLSVIALAVIASIFMLFDAPNIGARLSQKFGSDQQLLNNLGRFVTSTRDFIIVTTLAGFVEGVIIAIALYMIKVPFAATWGLLFWLFSYIPYLGIWLAVIPPALLATLELGPQYGLIVLVIYLLVSNAFKLFILSKVMGDKVDTSMTIGFLSLFFWGVVLGIFGILLAYPYTLLVRDVLLTNTDETWLVELMRKKSPVQDDIHLNA